MIVRPSKPMISQHREHIYKNRVWRLNRNTPITCGHCRNRERGVGDGVEHSNDLTDGVVARREGYLFTIGVRDLIGRIHIVEYCFTMFVF